MGEDDQNTNAPIACPRHRHTLTARCGGLFIVIVDNTVLKIAFPAIQPGPSATTSQLIRLVKALVVAFTGAALVMPGTLSLLSAMFDRIARVKAAAAAIADQRVLTTAGRASSAKLPPRWYSRRAEDGAWGTAPVGAALPGVGVGGAW